MIPEPPDELLERLWLEVAMTGKKVRHEYYPQYFVEAAWLGLRNQPDYIKMSLWYNGALLRSELVMPDGCRSYRTEIKEIPIE